MTTVEDTLGLADIYVTATGNRDIITIDHMAKMKDQAIVCNRITSYNVCYTKLLRH